MYHKPFDDVITPSVFDELARQAAEEVYFSHGFLTAFSFDSQVVVTVHCINENQSWRFRLDYDDSGRVTGNPSIVSSDKNDSDLMQEFADNFKTLIVAKRSKRDKASYEKEQHNFSTVSSTTSKTLEKTQSQFSAFIDEFDKRLNEGPSREFKNYRLIGSLIGFFSACAVVVLVIIFLKGMIDASKEPKEPENAIHIDVDASYFKDKNCYEVQTFFVDKGFEDVSLKALKDMTFGWIYTEYAVSSVTIDGKDDFKSDKWYLPTAPVIISYHSYS